MSVRLGPPLVAPVLVAEVLPNDANASSELRMDIASAMAASSLVHKAPHKGIGVKDRYGV